MSDLRPLIVGIAGGSGSGKTTIARHLDRAFPDEHLAVIPLDAHYRDRRELSPEERAQINYDHPDAFDEALLIEHLAVLHRGERIDQPLYDYAEHLRQTATRRVEPTAVVLIEGILVLALEKVRPLLDLKLYVETDADVRFLRRMRRDVAERGRTVESVMDQYLATVRPMHHAHVEPTRHYADLILPGEGRFDTAMTVLEAWVREALIRRGH